MKCESLQADMKYLFDCNYFDDSFDPEGNEEHQDFAEAVLAEYTWEDIYNWFFLHKTVASFAGEIPGRIHPDLRKRAEAIGGIGTHGLTERNTVGVCAEFHVVTVCF